MILMIPMRSFFLFFETLPSGFGGVMLMGLGWWEDAVPFMVCDPSSSLIYLFLPFLVSSFLLLLFPLINYFFILQICVAIINVRFDQLPPFYPVEK
ncbi:hypothetical protein F4804DRAFT_250673 [Jackrogersella minutella]|nr:hypothetical protein F4804DRAFT_250673 [Jackrogersella minutella]